jgi:hypothetical protein
MGKGTRSGSKDTNDTFHKDNYVLSAFSTTGTGLGQRVEVLLWVSGQGGDHEGLGRVC